MSTSERILWGLFWMIVVVGIGVTVFLIVDHNERAAQCAELGYTMIRGGCYDVERIELRP